MRRGRSELLPGTWTETLGFNGPHLGPTIRLRRGETVQMAVTNQLDEVSTVHWHGIRLPARMDGGPHQPIEPGATWTPRWTVDQPAATFWYHPHWQGSTASQVYRGLAGLLLVDEPDGPELPGTYGVDDIPLILQDKRFAPDGSLAGDPLRGTYGILGDRVLVNGTHDPYLEVTTERVRFRLLNGSNARVYHVRFADRRGFHVVANDAGLLDTPVEVDEISLTPAERVEIVARFTPGETATLRSVGGSTDIDQGDFDLLQIVAGTRLAASPPPDWTSRTPVTTLGARVRRFRLDGHDTINGRRMDLSRIDEVVPAGAREIWEVENGDHTHNFHIHGVSFRVLDVDGAPPPAHLAGPKDTVHVPKRVTVRLAVRFGHHTDPTAPYMYHCHILRHEDSGMMGQFVVVEPGTEEQVSRCLAAATGPADAPSGRSHSDGTPSPSY
jgi:FtsP/CotA-like multicopper oxidase with cupredoxin domain